MHKNKVEWRIIILGYLTSFKILFLKIFSKKIKLGSGIVSISLCLPNSTIIEVKMFKITKNILKAVIT
jgi:hypothetical protein